VAPAAGAAAAPAAGDAATDATTGDAADVAFAPTSLRGVSAALKRSAPLPSGGTTSKRTLAPCSIVSAVGSADVHAMSKRWRRSQPGPVSPVSSV